jgi:hypothetical protein
MEVKTKKGIVNLLEGQTVLLDNKEVQVLNIFSTFNCVYFIYKDNDTIFIKSLDELQYIVIEIVQVVKKTKSIWQKIKDFLKSLKI